LLFLGINPFLNWRGILNVSESYSSELSLLAIIIFTYFCLTFVFKIITTLLTAKQEPAKASLIELIGQFLSLAIVIILVKTTEGSIVRLGLALCVAPVLVLLGATVYFFQGNYRMYRPVISKVNFRYAKGLFSLGVVFFFIQLANIFQFQTANIIIARYFGTADVTAYNIVYKYFGVLLMVFTIFLTPFWSASTEAYLKNEIDWIKRGVRKYAQLSILLFLGGCLMLVFSGTVYRLWLGENKVHIEFSLSLFGFLFFATSLFGGTYVSFLNGINALRIQLLACIFSPFLYIISSLVLIKYLHLGVYSLYIAAILSNFNTFILAPLQYYQVVIKGRKGIWIR
jgi:O-antigen/teichoic acid export membrane protein